MGVWISVLGLKFSELNYSYRLLLMKTKIRRAFCLHQSIWKARIASQIDDMYEKALLILYSFEEVGLVPTCFVRNINTLQAYSRHFGGRFVILIVLRCTDWFC